VCKCVCVCQGACVLECVRACVRASSACMCMCVRACLRARVPVHYAMWGNNLSHESHMTCLKIPFKFNIGFHINTQRHCFIINASLSVAHIVRLQPPGQVRVNWTWCRNWKYDPTIHDNTYMFFASLGDDCWCCCYYFGRNSLIALLEALRARIFSLDSWISFFSDIFFCCVCKVSNKDFLSPLSTRILCLVVAIPLVCW